MDLVEEFLELGRYATLLHFLRCTHFCPNIKLGPLFHFPHSGQCPNIAWFPGCASPTYPWKIPPVTLYATKRMGSISFCDWNILTATRYKLQYAKTHCVIPGPTWEIWWRSMRRIPNMLVAASGPGCTDNPGDKCFPNPKSILSILLEGWPYNQCYPSVYPLCPICWHWFPGYKLCWWNKAAPFLHIWIDGISSCQVRCP